MSTNGRDACTSFKWINPWRSYARCNSVLKILEVSSYRLYRKNVKNWLFDVIARCYRTSLPCRNVMSKRVEQCVLCKHGWRKTRSIWVSFKRNLIDGRESLNTEIDQLWLFQSGESLRRETRRSAENLWKCQNSTESCWTSSNWIQWPLTPPRLLSLSRPMLFEFNWQKLNKSMKAIRRRSMTSTIVSMPKNANICPNGWPSKSTKINCRRCSTQPMNATMDSTIISRSNDSNKRSNSSPKNCRSWNLKWMLSARASSTSNIRNKNSQTCVPKARNSTTKFN